MESLQLWYASEWMVVCAREQLGYVVRWFLAKSGVECTRVDWSEDPPSLRVHEDDWLVFDARGRLLSLNVTSSQQQSLSLR